jgi:hypothetical protein
MTEKPNITREAIEAVAHEVNRPTLEVITDMQSAAARLGDEETLEALCAVKAQIIEEQR